jgi:hypothetical protein
VRLLGTHLFLTVLVEVPERGLHVMVSCGPTTLAATGAHVTRRAGYDLGKDCTGTHLAKGLFG